jgi:hypothetical protein
MSNFETVKSITDNLQTICQGLGIKFSRKTFEEPKNVPAALIPLGEIYYNGQVRQHNHGQGPQYIVINFSLKVVLKERDLQVMMRKQQEWINKLDDAITIQALNIGALASSQLVSWVSIEEEETDDDIDQSKVNLSVDIRFRRL